MAGKEEGGGKEASEGREDKGRGLVKELKRVIRVPVRGRAGQGAPAVTWVGRRRCDGDSEKCKGYAEGGWPRCLVTEQGIKGGLTSPAWAAAWCQALK